MLRDESMPYLRRAASERSVSTAYTSATSYGLNLAIDVTNPPFPPHAWPDLNTLGSKFRSIGHFTVNLCQFNLMPRKSASHTDWGGFCPCYSADFETPLHLGVLVSNLSRSTDVYVHTWFHHGMAHGQLACTHWCPVEEKCILYLSQKNCFDNFVE